MSEGGRCQMAGTMTSVKKYVHVMDVHMQKNK